MKISVVRGPDDILLIYTLEGMRESWRVANQTDRTASEVLKEVMSGRVRHAESVPFHPLTQSGTVYRDNVERVWYHEEGRKLAPLGSVSECVVVRLPDIRLQARSLSPNIGASARWNRIIGVLGTGDVAYPLRDGPPRLLVPCPPGHNRNIFMAVEGGRERFVVGLGVTRSLKGEMTVQSLRLDPPPSSFMIVSHHDRPYVLKLPF